MKLYEIDRGLEEMLIRLEADPETGEIPSDEEKEEILHEIHALASKRRDILVYLAKLVLNARAESAALKEEESRLQRRRQNCDKQETRVMAILDRECDGKKTDLDVATLRYRSVPHVEVTDEGAAVSWLLAQGLEVAVNQPAPTVYKSEVKRLMDKGREVPGCKLVTSRSASLK